MWTRDCGTFGRELVQYDFLHGPASPVKYLHTRVDKAPLLAGTGEFGSGMGAGGAQCNVVQNSLAMLALITAARMEEAAGDKTVGGQYRAAATQLPWIGRSGRAIRFDARIFWRRRAGRACASD